MFANRTTALLFLTALLLVWGCTKKDDPSPQEPANLTWADTLSWVTGGYQGVYTSWSNPANGPMTSNSKDTIMTFEPDPDAPGKFRIGTQVLNITLHHDLTLTIPTSYSFFNGHLEIGSNDIQLSYSRGVGSPGGSYGSNFTGTKNR